MRRTGGITVGIDVTETQVHMVALRRTSAGCVVLDAAAASIPEHAIEHGRIVDPGLLAKALKAVARRGRGPGASVAVSLPIHGTLTRIVPLMEQDPERIGQFVRDEIKQYAILSGHETSFDYRVLTAARQDVRGAVLVAATDRENVAALAAAARMAGLQITSIEPPAMACARLVGMDRAGGSGNGGAIVVLCKEGTLTTCVFRRGLLDFIRTEDINADSRGPEAMERRIADDVAAVLRFYSLRGGDAVEDWRIVLADEASLMPPAIGDWLHKSIAPANVSLLTPGSLPKGAGIDLRDREPTSLIAMGLALHTPATPEEGGSVNLLPPEVSAARHARRNVFVLANAMALMMLIAVLGTGAVAYTVKRVHQKTVAARQGSLKRGDRSLPVTRIEMGYIDERLKSLSAEIGYLKGVNDSHLAVDWVRFLDDVKNATPARRVRLTEMVCDGSATVAIRGIAASLDAVETFVDALNQSGQIRHAWVVRKDRNQKNKTYIEYEIQCVLSTGKAS
jgi:hypothetical protein